jgi:large subunit ribosomal protein L24e
MTVDSTLLFAARRNVPVRYNRELVATTLKAMQRVSEVRAKREKVFYKKRMEGNKARQREANRKLVEENQHLLPLHMRDDVESSLQEVDPQQLDSQRMEVEKARVVLGADDDSDWSGLSDDDNQKIKNKAPLKQSLLVNGGIDRMDMDHD